MPPVEIAHTTSDSEGRFEFTGLTPPRRYVRLERLTYEVFANTDKRPTAIGGIRPVQGSNHGSIEIRMLRKQATLTGKVVNGHGQPVVGATVTTYSIDGRPFRGILSTTTDTSGRFVLDRLMVFESRGAADFGVSFSVVHPDYPETTGKANALPADVVVTLPKCCIVASTVIDDVTGKPADGTLVTAEPRELGSQVFAITDANGHFRIVVPEGRYDFLAEAKDRVCVAATGHECLAGEKVELPPFSSSAADSSPARSSTRSLASRSPSPTAENRSCSGCSGRRSRQDRSSPRLGWRLWTRRADSSCVRPRGKTSPTS